jgi:hypothetical protein
VQAEVEAEAQAKERFERRVAQIHYEGRLNLGICSTRLNDGFPIQDGANSLIRVVSAS